VKIVVDGEPVKVAEFLTIKAALKSLGFKFADSLGEGRLYAPCCSGGCYACAATVDGALKPICITPVREGMDVRLGTPTEANPLRIVSGFQPHPVGGVGTPWQVKKSGRHYVEVACFAHGCNLRCPQCQNFGITYCNTEPPLTPREAANLITCQRRQYGVDRIAISGGEPTLNRRWLTQFFMELRRLNRDAKARFHLDTNTTVLTPYYVDELVEAGVTDIGPDLKGIRVETFMKITGIVKKGLAKKYLDNSWSAAKYLIDNYYPDKLFIGLGIPYNNSLMSLEELREIGDKIKEMTDTVQVCLLDYFPTFRRRNIKRPSTEEMVKARQVLKSSGLKIVLAQTPAGHIGP